MSTGHRPNILLIMTDQQSAHMLGCTGNPDVRTPHLDRLAGEGTRFERAYVTFPLCVPSRTSMLTGMHPHQLGVSTNSPAAEPSQVRGEQSLTGLLRAAGYRLGHAGKWHATRASAERDDGFEWTRDFGDEGLVEAATQFLQDRDDARPFFLVASFDDPHTICEVARNQPSYYGPLPAPDLASAPNLPANFGPQPFEPEAIRAEQRDAPFVYGTADYSPEDWRLYRQAYARLVERVDGRIGQLLSALDDARPGEDTLVIFTSDHGDGDAAHAWNQKTALFEETIRVPLIIRRPDHVGSGLVERALVSTGLDLLPTICDAAGIPAPPGLPGRSALAAPDRTGPRRDHVVVETGFGSGARPRTVGRAVVGERYKYVVYSWGRHREQLFDLFDDPGEEVNLAVEARHAGLLQQQRALLLEWCLATDDRLMLKRLVLPEGTPSHVRRQINAVPY